MGHLYRKIFAFLFFAFTLPAYPQIDTTGGIEDDIIDNLLGESTDESESSEIINAIESLVDDPININSADVSELQKIPYIDFNYAEKIIRHREAYGKYISREELYSIEGISPEIIQKIIPLIYIGEVKVSFDNNLNNYFPSGLYSNSVIKIRNRISKSLQPQDGYTGNKFEGTQVKMYNRLLWQYADKIQAEILTEKDAGEKAFNDFTSAHISLKNFLVFDNLILGDFNLQFGQGLALWSPYGFSKGLDAITAAKKGGNSIIPYKSTDENNFFRGIAFTASWKSFKFSGYASKNYIDASIDPAANLIFSTPADGYHRTESEIGKRKTVMETSFGMNISLKFNEDYNAGFFIYHSLFDKTFQPASNYGLAGSTFTYYSFYYDLYLLNTNIFGESVYNGKSIAGISTIQFSNGDNFIFLVSLRSYPRNYTNLHGLGFGERSKDLNNEFGIYTGIKWKVPLGLINFYFDQFKFPLNSYQDPMPSYGNELMLNLSSKPFSTIETKAAYKYQNKEIGADINNSIRITRRVRHAYSFELRKRINERLNLKCRFQLTNFDLKGVGLEKGVSFFNEFRLQVLRPLVFLGRIIFYRTDSFNSAIYEYEGGFKGMLSNIALYGEGIRWYCIIRYALFNQVELSAKYSETYKPKETTLSSGYNSINGNLDNSFYMQLDWEF